MNRRHIKRSVFALAAALALSSTLVVARPADAAQYFTPVVVSQTATETGGRLLVTVKPGCVDTEEAASLRVEAAQVVPGTTRVVRGVGLYSGVYCYDLPGAGGTAVVAVTPEPGTAFRDGQALVVAIDYECWRAGEDAACATLQPGWAVVTVTRSHASSDRQRDQRSPSAAHVADADPRYAADMEATVGRRARLLANGAGVLMQASVLCTAGNAATAYEETARIEVGQVRRGSFIAHGELDASVYGSLACDGAHNTMFLPVITDTGHAFRAGPAVAWMTYRTRLSDDYGETSAEVSTTTIPGRVQLVR